MARTVYLHVGAPKTGTSYLQSRLAANAEGLKEQGYSYPVGASGSMFEAAIDLIDRPWGGLLEGARGEWKALSERVRSASGNVIVSHEVFAGASTEQATRALADLGAETIRLVYSVRDLGRQLPAEWQESVKHQNEKSFRQFLAKAQRRYSLDSTMWFWRVQNVPSVIGRWAQGLSPDQVQIVTVPQPGAPRDQLWLRYCQAFGLDPAPLVNETSVANESLGLAEVALLRRLNSHLSATRAISNETYRTVVRGVLAHQALGGRPGSTRITLPEDFMAWASEITGEWIDYLTVSEVRVVGELEDLRIPPGVIGQAATNTKEMLDAALVALEALLVEIERRPDLDDPAVRAAAKVGRRIRV